MSGWVGSPRGVIRTTLLGGVLAVGTITVAAGTDADTSGPTEIAPGRDEVIEAVFAGVEPALVPFRYACRSWHFRAIDLLQGERPSQLVPPLDADEDARVLHRSGDDAVLGAVRLSPEVGIDYTHHRLEDGRWTEDGSGVCRPRAVVLPSRAKGGHWRLDGRRAEPHRRSRRLHLRVWSDRGCRAPVEVVSRPRVQLTAGAVLVVVPTRTTEDADACTPGPATRVTARFSEPIGERPIIDAGSLPFRVVDPGTDRTGVHEIAVEPVGCAPPARDAIVRAEALLAARGTYGGRIGYGSPEPIPLFHVTEDLPPVVDALTNAMGTCFAFRIRRVERTLDELDGLARGIEARRGDLAAAGAPLVSVRPNVVRNRVDVFVDGRLRSARRVLRREADVIRLARRAAGPERRSSRTRARRRRSTVSKTRRKDGVVITMELVGGRRLVAGRPVTIRTTVRNRRGEPISIPQSPECTSAIHVTGWMTDARWERFETVDGPPRAENGGFVRPITDLRWRIQDDWVDWWPRIWLPFVEPGARGCGDIAFETVIPPGGVIRERLVWDGHAGPDLGPPPNGTVRLSGWTQYRLAGAEKRTGMRIRLETEVVDGRDPSWVAPMDIVDAAVAELEAAGLLAGVSLGYLDDSYIAFDSERGVWVVGTCGRFDGESVRWRAVTLDPATGRAIERFDRVGGSDCDAGAFAGEEPGSAAPMGPACDGTVATSGVAWGDTIARLEACRDGWGASYDLAIDGPLADAGGCLAARVELAVVSAAGETVPAATEWIPIDCREPAPSRGWSGRLEPPPVGVGIGAVGLTLCDVDGECRSAEVDLPQLPTRADTDRLAEMDELMSMPIEAFIELKARSVDDDAYTWADDGCSISSAIPGSAVIDIPVLEDACRRHDWGYRNFGSVKGWDRTDDRRASVDDRLLADAEASCVARLDRPELVDACLATARAMVGLVRTFGARAFYGD